MIPDKPAPGTRSAAELRVFERLRDRTPKSVVAFHHVAWLTPTDGRPRQGEADFVIADPRAGIVVLEVKGGGIRYDAETAKWASVGLEGTHEIRDPIEQARNSSFILRDALAHASGRSRAAWRVGHGVAFPDTQVHAKALRLDAPRDIVLDANDFDAPGERLKGLFRYWSGDAPEPLGEDGVRLVKRVLANSFELRAPLAVALADDDRALMRLTEEQYVVLDVLARQTRVAIAGCAGSGKTFVAVEKARRLAAQGFRVLLLCYNLLLAEHLRRVFRGVVGVEALAFFEFCEKILWERGETVGVSRDDPGYYQQVFQAFERIAPDVTGKYDALIVDEAQDFQPGWWLPLQILLTDPDGSPLYVFYDANQRIFPVKKESLPVPGEPMLLSRNCRNTQRIHRVVRAYYEGQEIEAVGPEGLPVEVTTYRNRKELHTRLDAAIRKWLGEAEIQPADIALLTPQSLNGSVLSWSDELGGMRLTDDPFDEHGLLRSSVYRFKGLERRVVAVVEVDDGARAQILYVGFSRPSVFLSIFATEGGLSKLPAALRKKPEAVRSG